jgi:RNA polymerase sigma-70 factor (sigma-E family)
MGGRDEGEFVEFASSASEGMRRTAYLMCGDWHRAADLTQEALIRVYVAWPRLDEHAGLYRYARQTVVNVAIDAARKRSSSEVPGSSAMTDHRVDDPTPQVADRMLLMRALADLPSRQRACVVLRYYEDLGVDEVASLLGWRQGTVKSQTARGLQALRQSLGRRRGERRPDPQAAREATTG